VRTVYGVVKSWERALQTGGGGGRFVCWGCSDGELSIWDDAAYARTDDIVVDVCHIWLGGHDARAILADDKNGAGFLLCGFFGPWRFRC